MKIVVESLPPQPWRWIRVSMVYPTLNSFDKERIEYEAARRDMGMAVFTLGGYIHAHLFGGPVLDRLTDEDLAVMKQSNREIEDKFPRPA